MKTKKKKNVQVFSRIRALTISMAINPYSVFREEMRDRYKGKV